MSAGGCVLPLSARLVRARVTTTHLHAAHPRAGTITDRVNDMAPTILDVFKARQTIEDALRCERAPVPPPHERVHSPVGPLMPFKISPTPCWSLSV